MPLAGLGRGHLYRRFVGFQDACDQMPENTQVWRYPIAGARHYRVNFAGRRLCGAPAISSESPPMETPWPVGWLPTMGLQQFEQRLERLVEGAFAKAFRSGLQPVEIGRRITREMDLGRRVGVRGLIAPNHFKVNLPVWRLRAFLVVPRFACTRARRRAHESTPGPRATSSSGPVQVELCEDPEMRPNRYSIDSEVREGPDGLPAGSLRLADGRRISIGAQSLVLGRLPECAVVLE